MADDLKRQSGDILDLLSGADYPGETGARVLDVYWDQANGEFVLVEGCDECFSIRLKPAQLRILGSELIGLSMAPQRG